MQIFIDRANKLKDKKFAYSNLKSFNLAQRMAAIRYLKIVEIGCIKVNDARTVANKINRYIGGIGKEVVYYSELHGLVYLKNCRVN